LNKNLKFIFLDSEFLTLSKSKSTFVEVKKHQKELFPEIFQFSFIKVYSIDNFNKNKKFNFYIKTKSKISYRLLKLTNYKPSVQNIITPKLFLQKIKLSFNENFIYIANGGDLKLLKLNIKFNHISNIGKRLKYIDLRIFLKKIYGRDFNTALLKKKFLPNSKIRIHNSLNDSLILLKVLDKIKKDMGKKYFINLINKSLKTINL
jgi:hypothetical protein